jgi:glycosyltransferase involved in cell wall biosynthesis
MTPKIITLAFCTYNRAERLEKLVEAIRRQITSIPFDILAVNNNSTDHSLTELERLSKLPGPVLRYVTETEQGIVAARNRAIEECLHSDVMIFIDDDEIPLPGLIESAVQSILQQGAECVGGKVALDFSTHARPPWLKNELLGFLAEVDYGNEPFWIKEASTPVWTANIAYKMSLFRDNPDLRFDKRYDRKGKVIGGGSDAAMFVTMLKQGSRLYYNPGMCVLHDVEPWRLHRNYFLKLHYRSGMRKAYNELPNYPRTLFGIPPFLIKQLLKHSFKTAWMYLTFNSGKLRQAMNASYTLGMITGYRSKETRP